MKTERIIWGLGIFTLGKVKTKRFYHSDCLFFIRHGEGLCNRIPYWCLTRKIPDWLIKSIFLREVETAIRSVIKSRFGICLLYTSDAADE